MIPLLRSCVVILIGISFIFPSCNPSSSLMANCGVDGGDCERYPPGAYRGGCYGGGCCGISCHDPYQMIGGAAILGGIVGAITGYAAGRTKKGDRGKKGKPGPIGLPGPPGPPAPVNPKVLGALLITYEVEAGLEGDGILRGLLVQPDQTVLATGNLMTGESDSILLMPELCTGNYTLSWFVVAPFTGPDPTILGTITADDMMNVATFVTPEFVAADQPVAGDQIFFEYVFPSSP